MSVSRGATINLDSHVLQVAAHRWSKPDLTLLSATRFDLHDDTHALCSVKDDESTKTSRDIAKGQGSLRVRRCVRGQTDAAPAAAARLSGVSS